jgi:hypothetical protein
MSGGSASERIECPADFSQRSRLTHTAEKFHLFRNKTKLVHPYQHMVRRN